MICVTFTPSTAAHEWGLRSVLQKLNCVVSVNATITAAFVNVSVIRKWNKQYRGNNSPTDVLSFGWEIGEGLPFEALAKKGIVGDVLLCKSVLAQEATRSALTLQQLVQHRFIHGILHILGHDHEYQAQAQRMEDLERRLLGFDPYRPLVK